MKKGLASQGRVYGIFGPIFDLGEEVGPQLYKYLTG